MINDPNQLLYDFRLDLERFGEEVENGAVMVLHESATRALQAIVSGNDYGPGIPVDTGGARSSFRVGINAPADGPTEPPMRFLQRVGGNKYLRRSVAVQKNKGLGQIPIPPVQSEIANAQLGDTIYVNTMMEYPQYLEFNHLRRRFGKNKGMDTEFIAPVEARWNQLVDDAAVKVGYGA